MSRPRIGLSACIFHPDFERPIFKGKSLLYAEESMMGWVAANGGFPVCLPRPIQGLSNDDILDGIDGLLLQGGVDMSPRSYGEEPLRDAWRGDGIRDVYELGLLKRALERGVPVLAVCRGTQVLNVALGGTLWQDIQTQKEGSIEHRNAELYDALHHDIELLPGGVLERLHPEGPIVRVNSVHHQGIKQLAPELNVEARSVEDGIIEGVSMNSDGRWCVGVQWHPEFIDERFPDLLDRDPLMREFLEACSEGRSEGGIHGTA